MKRTAGVVVLAIAVGTAAGAATQLFSGSSRPADAAVTPARMAQAAPNAAAANGVPVPAEPVPLGQPGGLPSPSVPQSQAQIDLSFAPLVRQTAPAVVNVYAARATPQRRSPFADDPFFGRFFDQDGRPPRLQSSLGSGVIVTPDGLVITNNHVVANADEVKVAFADGREFECEIVSRDDKVDLAVLRIRGPGPFPVLPLGNSDEAQIGDLVLAIGNPFGIGQTVTNGIVSALARTHVGVNDFGFFIQTDAAINPGNSGGALIDMKGRLIGVNTAIFSRSGGSNGIGFAIPSNMVRAFVQAAESGNAFERPFIGASFLPVTPDIAGALGLDRPTGALVQGVLSGGPAQVAGIEVGDVVMAMNGVPIENPDALGYRLATAGIGTTVEVEVLRRDARQRLLLKLDAAPEVPPRDGRRLAGRTPFSGLDIANLSPKLAGELDMPQDATGVVVVGVVRGSFADRFGFAAGDVILSLNGEPVESTAALEAILADSPPGWTFEVRRGDQVFAQRVR